MLVRFMLTDSTRGWNPFKLIRTAERVRSNLSCIQGPRTCKLSGTEAIVTRATVPTHPITDRISCLAPVLSHAGAFPSLPHTLLLPKPEERPALAAPRAHDPWANAS